MGNGGDVEGAPGRTPPLVLPRHPNHVQQSYTESREDPSTSRSEAPSSPKSEASSSGGVSSTISPHYDSQQDVIVRLEHLSGKQMRVVVLSIWAAVLVGLGLLAMSLDFKVDKASHFFTRDQTLARINLSFAVVLLVGLVGTWAIFMRRVNIANRTGKRWSHRRKRGVALAGIELSMQLVNVVFFLVPNAYVLAGECAWFGSVVLWSGLVRWTIWNSIFFMFWVQAHSTHPAKGYWARFVDRPDGAVMDAPWWAHWHKLPMWLGFEGVLLALTVCLETGTVPVVVPPGTEGDCTQWDYNCTLSGATLGLVISVQCCIVLYAVGFLFFIRRSFAILFNMPYQKFRIANFMVRLQLRLRLVAFLFFVLSSVVYFFVGINTCPSFISSWLGFLPMQFVMTCIACVNAFIYMPKRPQEKNILQVWLQEFAWTEADVPRKRRERSSSLPPDSFEMFSMDSEPMFCFETAIKMMYWSYLVYDYEEVKQSPFQRGTALSLYDLQNFELFWEKALDTKAIVGWNENTVVIAFRGTASLANVKADLQAWRTHYPADIGSGWLCTAPMVHQGFYRAWTSKGFNDRLIGRLEHILYRCVQQQQDEEAGTRGEGGLINVYVTGHSLGGALATLCAYDIKQRCPCAAYSVNVHVYTFGAPRTGNRAFARLYNEVLPDTWSLINNDDAVTRAGKFYGLYKRPGHRVLLNKRGDLVVRPSFVEASIRQAPGAGSIRDHLLTQYQKAMVAVVAAQFGRKSFHDGKDGVLSLAREQGTRQVLQAAGLAADRIKCLEVHGSDAECVQAAITGQTPRQGSKTRRVLQVLSPRHRRKESVDSMGGGGEKEREEGQEEGALQQVVVEEEGKASQAQVAGTEAAAPAAAAGAAVQQPPPPAAAGEQARQPAAQQPAAQHRRGDSAVEEVVDDSGGIMHKQVRRVGVGRKGKSHTVCSIMQHRRGWLRRGQVAQAPPPASPMCDAPAGAKGDGAVDGDAAAEPLSRVSVMGIASQLSPPDTPHAVGNSTRGDVSEQPAFSLVLSTPSGHFPSQSIELVPEEEEEAEGEEEEAGKGGQVVWGGGDAPTAAPGVPVMGRN